MITPTEDEQIIFADQAHQRAEIAFEGLGWISFEPTSPGEGAPGRAQLSTTTPVRLPAKRIANGVRPTNRATRKRRTLMSQADQQARRALEDRSAQSVYQTGEPAGAVILDLLAKTENRCSRLPGCRRIQAYPGPYGGFPGVHVLRAHKRTEIPDHRNRRCL